MPNTSAPTTLTAGDHYTWTETSTTAGERWEYVFAGEDGHRLAIKGSFSAPTWTFAITMADSSSLKQGVYSITRLVYADGERTTTRKTATLKVYPDPATEKEPSHSEKMVKAIRASLEGAAPEFLEGHSVNGISITKMSISERQQLLRNYEARLARERDRERVARGQSSNREILIQF